MGMYGDERNKLCTIVDIVNERRVVVDGPKSATGVDRQQIPIKWLGLTDFKAKVQRGTRAKQLKQAIEAGAVLTQWKQSQWGKRIAAKDAKSKLTDLDRFKVMLAKKTRAKLIAKKLKK